MPVNQGDALRKFLKEKGKTQSDLASYMDKKQGWISTVLKRELIDNDFLNQVATFLNMSFDDLFQVVNTEEKKTEEVIRLTKELAAARQMIKQQEETLRLYRKMEKEREGGS